MSRHPTGRITPIADWPTFDREAWRRACASRDPFDPSVGFAARWRPVTQEMIESGYGGWLAYLAQADMLVLSAPPGARATRANLDGYRRQLLSWGLADNTIAGRLRHLANMLLTIAPDGDWKWIFRASSRIAAKAVLVNDPVTRMQDAGDVLRLAEELMDDAETGKFRRAIYRAASFRDGLMMAFLIRRPLRRRNLQGMILGDTLYRQGETWRLRFPADEVKTGVAIEATWPSELVGRLERYESYYRPMLLDGPPDGPAATQHLWVSAHGRPLPEGKISFQVSARTRKAFGRSINPHTFRHIAATTVATSTPEAAMEIADILGHQTIETSEKYYNRAKVLGAGTTYQRTLASYRQKRKGRDKRGHCPP